MRTIDTLWIDRVTPVAGRQVPIPFSDPELVSAVTALVGPDAVAWASQIGFDATARIIDAMPHFGASPELRDLLHAACESAALGALATLAAPDAAPLPLTHEAQRAITHYARAGIALDQIFKGIRFGHADISSEFLAACEALLDGENGRSVTLRAVSARLFDYFERYASEGGDLYNTARETWAESSDATLTRVVDAVLSGEDPDPDDVASFPYLLDQPHRAVVIRRTQASGPAPRNVAYEALRRVGASSRLVITRDSTTVVAWAGGRSPQSAMRMLWTAPTGIRIAFGASLDGPDGFRESHRQAVEVSSLQARNRHVADVVAYDEIEMVVLLARDPTAARGFVRRVLGPLATADRRSEELRATVKAYLDLHGSPSAVAERLHLARNTVSARIQRASLLLDRELGADCSDLHCALAMVETLGDPFLDPDHD